MSQDLKAKAVVSLFWSTVERSAERGIQFVVSVVLARMLAPEQFGVMVMLTVFITLARTLVDSGFASALIQKKDVTYVDECSVFYLNIFLAAVMAGLLWTAAPWIASFYGISLLVPVTRVLSLKLITSSFGIIHVTLLKRRLDFKTMVKARTVSVMTSGAVGITMARLGFGVWSLVGQQLTASVMNSLALWVWCPWRPSRLFSLSSLKRMFGYGSRLLASGLINTVFQNLCPLVIGKLFMPAQLAYFMRAVSLQKLPETNIFGPLRQVMFPVLARIHDDKERLKAVTHRILVSAALVNFPLMIGLALVAGPLVRVLLGERWGPCVPYLQWMCVSGLLFPLHLVNVNVLKARGRSDLFLRLELVKKTLTLGVILVTYRWGIQAMIAGQVAQSAIAYYINTYYTGKLLDYPFREQFRSVVPYLLTSGLMGCGVYAVQFMRWDTSMALLLAQVSAGCLLYLVLCCLFRLSAFTQAIETAGPYIKGAFRNKVRDMIKA